jgi:NADPH:quinone reductase-like Zn-dependent oxidoreductase
LTFEEAASIPLVGLTAWQAFVEHGKLRPGQKVFIQAGSGGVGTFAIQLAKNLGAFVATTTSKENSDFVRSLGADLVIDYKKDDFEQKLSEFDFVLHSQDQLNLEKSLRILKPKTQLISISGPPDPAFAKRQGYNFVLRTAMFFLSKRVRKISKKLKIHYSFLFMHADGKQLEEISKLIESGKIKPTIDRVFEFKNTNEALDYVGTGRAKGKVVIAINRDQG